ncbi:hypothetical protein [Agrococcus sp. Marseille-P2731]|uniref:hypothetical protein n=1 Tax=Agrococcus sp. Marseille-P2731 TaxID=1841862 RepID=UPI0011605EBC|nr:hypothetical protein [Agrococcus sp. Marseille-P2731]
MHESNQHDQARQGQEHDAPAQEDSVVDSGAESGGTVQQPDPAVGEDAKENPVEGFDPESESSGA